MEHFAKFRPKAVEATNNSFIVSIQSLIPAKEAVDVFNNSLLKGVQISVNFEGGLPFHEQPGFLGHLSPSVSRDVRSLASSPSQYVVDEAKGSTSSLGYMTTEYCGKGSLFYQEPQFVGEPCNVFIYSNPKFPDFVQRKDLMEHFQVFSPVDAFIIKKKGQSTGTAKITFRSKAVAEEAMRVKKGTKVLDCYSISLKFEDPAHPPKSTSRRHIYQANGDGRSKQMPTEYSEPPQGQPTVGGAAQASKWAFPMGSFQGHPVAGVPTQQLPKSQTCAQQADKIHLKQYVHEDPSRLQPKSSKGTNHHSTQVDGQLSPILLPHQLLSHQSQKCVEPLPKKSMTTKVKVKAITHEVMKLLPGQFNRLMVVGPEGTNLLEDLITPYKDNPNISIQPALKERVLEFTGKGETVQSALKYFRAQLKKDLEIDRYV
jgi:hypothetical protein